MCGGSAASSEPLFSDNDGSNWIELYLKCEIHDRIAMEIVRIA